MTVSVRNVVILKQSEEFLLKVHLAMVLLLSMAFIPCCQAMPPGNGQSLSRSGGGIDGWRTFELNTQ